MPSAREIFHTERLLIREFADEDWRVLQEFGGRPEVARMMTSLKSPWPEAEVKAWISASHYRGKSGFRAAIELPGSGLIGFLGLGGTPVPSCAYAFAPEHWGRGYAREALAGLMRLAFEELGLSEVIADYYIDNPASGRVLKACGFREVETIMAASMARDELEPAMLCRLTRADWLAAHQEGPASAP